VGCQWTTNGLLEEGPINFKKGSLKGIYVFLSVLEELIRLGFRKKEKN